MIKIFFAVLLCAESLFAWGGTTHKYINKNAVIHLPPSMQKFIDQQAYLETHAVDADNRKGSDATEGPKHFLDIDYYPNYKNLTRSLDSLIAKYGTQVVVNDNGILPWATVWAMDSLTAQLKRGDWTKAYLTGADVGHYVADGHQPLHVAQNYDGQISVPSQKGLHSRYESTMMGTYLNAVQLSKDSVHYISNPIEFIFSYLLVSNALVDSILLGDKYAAPPNGSSGGTLPADYYPKLWAKTQQLTNQELQSSTIDLASLWYTAFVNAGLITKPASVDQFTIVQPRQFVLSQNFPNPFNPSTTIQYQLPAENATTLIIFDMVGREIATLVNTVQQSGSYSVRFNAADLPSGVYVYRLQSGGFSAAQKFVLVK
jgi:hypothetical protein